MLSYELSCLIFFSLPTSPLRPKVGAETPGLRRSLRIFAQQKLKEEQVKHSVNSTISKRPTKASKSEHTCASTSGEGGKELQQDKRLRTEGEKTKKRKRTSSPPVSSIPPKKQAKKSPINRAKGIKKELPVISGSENKIDQEAPLDNQSRTGGKKGSRGRKLSPKRDSIKDRDTVIVEASPSGVRTKRKNRKRSDTEGHKEECTSTELEPLSSKRACSGRRGKDTKGKEKPKERAKSSRQRVKNNPKGKGTVNWNTVNSLPSFVDFARLNMASPE